jgi:hypothetical protein
MGLKSPLSAVTGLSSALAGDSAGLGVGVGVGVLQEGAKGKSLQLIGGGGDSIKVGRGAFIVGLGVGVGVLQEGAKGKSLQLIGGGGISFRVWSGALSVGVRPEVGVGVGVASPCISPDINGKGLSVQLGGMGPLSGHFGGVGGNGFIVQSGGIGPVSGQSRAIILLPPPPLRILSWTGGEPLPKNPLEPGDGVSSGGLVSSFPVLALSCSPLWPPPLPPCCTPS